MRALLVIFLLGHAAVHAVMWTLPLTAAVNDMPFDPGRSWIVGQQRTIAAAAAVAVTLAFVVVALGFAVEAAWWPTAMAAASAASLVLMAVFFTPWWVVGIALDAALIVYAMQAAPS